MGQASPRKAKGLSMGAVPHSLPGSGLMGREHVGHPPAVLPTSRPCPKVPGGVKPTAASRAGPHLGSEPLPAPGRPSGSSRLRSGCTPVAPGTTQTERPPLCSGSGCRGTVGTDRVVPPAVTLQAGHGAPPTAPHPAQGRAPSAGQHGRRRSSPPTQPCRALRLHLGKGPSGSKGSGSPAPVGVPGPAGPWSALLPTSSRPCAWPSLTQAPALTQAPTLDLGTNPDPGTSPPVSPALWPSSL